MSLKEAWRKLATAPVVLYQHTLSPDHGPLRGLWAYGACRFHPTCSEYCRQAILKYGALRGYAKGIHRIFRCHPWSAGGVDHP